MEKASYLVEDVQWLITSENLISEPAEMPGPQQQIGLDSNFCLQAGGLRAKERPLHFLQLGDEGSGLGVSADCARAGHEEEQHGEPAQADTEKHRETVHRQWIEGAELSMVGIQLICDFEPKDLLQYTCLLICIFPCQAYCTFVRKHFPKDKQLGYLKEVYLYSYNDSELLLFFNS